MCGLCQSLCLSSRLLTISPSLDIENPTAKNHIREIFEFTTGCPFIVNGNNTRMTRLFVDQEGTERRNELQTLLSYTLQARNYRFCASSLEGSELEIYFKKRPIERDHTLIRNRLLKAFKRISENENENKSIGTIRNFRFDQ